MFFYSGFDNAKKVALVALLLTPPMFVQAQTIDVAAEETSSSEQQRTHYLPRWPEQRKQHEERVPPPPPGPYMSTALSGSPAKWSSFEPGNKPAVMFEPPASPMHAFSPDIPWHSNSTSPDRWKPEDGYHYVKPPVKKQSYPAMRYNMPPSRNYGYRAPVMNWPGSSARSMPFRGPSARMNPGRAGAASPGVARPYARPHARPQVSSPKGRSQSTGYGRPRPVINNPAMSSRQPANRVPYPAAGQP